MSTWDETNEQFLNAFNDTGLLFAQLAHNQSCLLIENPSGAQKILETASGFDELDDELRFCQMTFHLRVFCLRKFLIKKLPRTKANDAERSKKLSCICDLLIFLNLQKHKT